MYWIFVVFCSILSLLNFENVYAESVKLDEIVVTAARTEEEISKIPANVTVITREDIEKSTASTVQDLLRNEEGLVINDLYGSGTKSTVDMRGFASGLNTVILLDGRRLNEIDLSGVDWNLIPMENIERVEVVRGSGSVLYGDNAMAGVINIITKKGKAMKTEAEIQTRVESFDGDTEHFSLRGGTDKVNYFIFAKQRETEGYRDNSEFNANDLNAKLGFNISDKLSIDFSGIYHTDQQGYPGGLSESELKSDRTQTLKPDEGADYEQYLYGANLKYATGNRGDIEIGYNFNSREFDVDISGGNIIRDTDSDDIKLKYIGKPNIFNYNNLLVIGLDRYAARVDDRRIIPSWFMDDTISISKIDYGYYLQDEFYFNDKLSLNLGYRYTETELKNNVCATTCESSKQDFNESASKTGITYNYKQGSKGFISYSKGYRLPTTDELSLAIGNLIPERAYTYEGGIVHSFNNRSEIRMTLYSMNIKNEIYFNPTIGMFGANENIDKTNHQGAELGIHAALAESFSLFGNWTYTSATYESGPNDGKTIPLLPQQSANLGGNIKFSKHYLITFKGNWVGERFIGDDFDNSAEKLPDYITFDSKLSFEDNRFNVYIGVNNVFNKEYVEYGNVWGALYPSPERNYYGGIKVYF